MKIAVIAEVLNSKSGARAPIELAIQLSKNHQVYFFAYRNNCDQETRKIMEKSGIKVTLYPKNVLSVFPLYFSLKKGSFNILSLHCFLPFFLAAKFSGILSVRTYYGTQQDVWFEKLLPNQKPNLLDRLINNLLNRFIVLRERFFFDNSDLNIAISKYTMKEAKTLYKKDISFIYLGVNFPQRSDTPISSKVPRRISFLSVSRITPYKNFHLIIESFKNVHLKYPETSLIIAGSAPNLKYLNYLKDLVDKNQDIEILTSVSEEKLVQLYQQADVYLSADRYSFFGLPPLEAASFGLPTIALNYAALPEIIQDKKTGLIANNKEEFEKLMEQIVRDYMLKKTLGKGARNRVKKYFTWENFTDQYQRIITGQLAHK